MQNVYACQLNIPAEQTDLALDLSAKWLWGNRANRNTWTDSSFVSTSDRARVTRGTHEEHANGELWDGTLTHLHQEDEGISVVARIEILSKGGEATSFLTTIELRRDDGDLRPIRVPINAPRLPREVLSICECMDGGKQLTETPELLQAKDVSTFVEFLLSRERRLPVVLITHDTRLDTRYVDELRLARELAGLAHVYFTDYGRPANELTSELGQDLSAWGGAARIWWPGVTPSAGRYANPLLTPRRLTRADGEPNPSLGVNRMRERVWRVVSDSMFQPVSHREVRRSIRINQLTSARDADGFFQEWEKTQKELEAERAISVARQEKIDQLEDELQSVRDQFHVFDTATSGEDIDQGAEPFVPTTVLEAVEFAAGNLRNLEFAPRAYESAEDSPFTRPDQILDALKKLDDLAGLEKQANGIGKKRTDAAEGMGLTWRGGIGATTRGKYPEEYSTLWHGQRIELGPHVNLGSGSGAGNIARIYFYCHEADEPSERCYVICHVGRKLPDGTTG